jgi:hypothetical protein
MRYIVESYLERRWTQVDIEAAAVFYRRAACAVRRRTLCAARACDVVTHARARLPGRRSTHNVGGTPFPFPRALFEKFVRENDGACTAADTRRRSNDAVRAQRRPCSALGRILSCAVGGTA